MHTPHLNLAARIQCPLLHQALMDGGLVTDGIHQSLICTPLNTHRYLVMPGLIGGSPRGQWDSGTSWDSGPGNARGPCISSRPAQALPPPQRQKEGQGIVGERRKMVLRHALLPPSPGVSFPLAITTPLGGPRGRQNPRPRSRA